MVRAECLTTAQSGAVFSVFSSLTDGCMTGEIPVLTRLTDSLYFTTLLKLLQCLLETYVIGLTLYPS